MTAVAAHTDELATLVEEHGDAIRQLCSRRLGPSHDVDDAVQEVLMRAWGALPSFDPRRPMWPWLATIAGNVCIDFTRRQQADQRRRGRDLVVVLPDDGPEHHERDQIVREAMARLPNPAATALFLRDVGGWDYEQIGAHLNRNPGAARTAVSRARHQLRSHLETIARSKGQWPLGVTLGPLWARLRHPIDELRSGRYTEIAQAVTLHAVEVTVAAAVLFSAAPIGAPATDPAAPAITAHTADDGVGNQAARTFGILQVDRGAAATAQATAPSGALLPDIPSDTDVPAAPVDPPLHDGIAIHEGDLPIGEVPEVEAPSVRLTAPDPDDPSAEPSALDPGVDPSDQLPAG